MLTYCRVSCEWVLGGRVLWVQVPLVQVCRCFSITFSLMAQIFLMNCQWSWKMFCARGLDLTWLGKRFATKSFPGMLQSAEQFLNPKLANVQNLGRNNGSFINNVHWTDSYYDWTSFPTLQFSYSTGNFNVDFIFSTYWRLFGGQGKWSGQISSIPVLSVKKCFIPGQAPAVLCKLKSVCGHVKSDWKASHIWCQDL